MTPQVSIAARRVPLGADDGGCLAVWKAIFDAARVPGLHSAEWMGTFVDSHRLRLAGSAFVLFEEAGKAVGIAFLGRRTARRHVVFTSRTFSLNSSGDPRLDIVWIEHNRVVSLPGYEEVVAESLLSLARETEDWDEFLLPGMPGGSPLAELSRRYDREDSSCIVERRIPNHAVDLDAVRRRGGEYLDTLPREGRRNLRRAIRHYEGYGECRDHEAGTTEEALSWFRALGELNLRRMGRIGKESSFADPGFVRFHEEYLRRAHPSGQALLQKFTAGTRVVGYHYCIASFGRLLAYQCGYEYEEKGSVSPGFYCLYRSIMRSLDRGFSSFDFLSGDVLYKKDLSGSLAPGMMEWHVLRRHRLRFAAEDRLRSAWKALRGRPTPCAPGEATP